MSVTCPESQNQLATDSQRWCSSLIPQCSFLYSQKHEPKEKSFPEDSLLQSILNLLKSRDVTLPTKVRLVKAMVFPVVMYGFESWTIKKAEHQRIDAFELWCWRLLRVPWTVRRSNQSILKEISPEYSLEGLMLKLKLQYFGHLMRRTDSLEQTLMLGKIEGRRRRGWKIVGWHHQLDGDELKQAPEVGDGQGSLACCSPWGHKELDTTEQLNWKLKNSSLSVRGRGVHLKRNGAEVKRIN